MAQLTCERFEDMGELFCIEDYIEYLREATQLDKTSFDTYMEMVFPRMHCAGMVIFDEDTLETVEGFLNLCEWSRPDVIMIDFSNMQNEELLTEFAELIADKTGDHYINLNSYENRFSFGRKWE